MKNNLNWAKIDHFLCFFLWFIHLLALALLLADVLPQAFKLGTTTRR